MKEQLKRELNKTYLVLSSEGTEYEESYELEMILKNEPASILPLHVLRVDEVVELYYDVSAKQTLGDYAARTKLSCQMIHDLFEAIDQLLREVKNYMLDGDNIVLQLDHIYVKEGKYYFCYCPWESRDLMHSFRMMLEDILGNLDYHDTEAVELSYHLYQKACKGEFQISEILEDHQRKHQESALSESAREESFPVETDNMIMEESSFDAKRKPEEKKQRQRLLRSFLGLFMKKEDSKPPAEEMISEAENDSGKIYMPSYDTSTSTTVLTPTDHQTTLLQNMPMGSWRLRPLLAGFEEFCISGDTFVVGKQRNAVDGVIERESISRIHCRLMVRGERLFIADANSTNGTFVNGMGVQPGKEVEIFPGDRIMFADVGYECYNSL